MAVLAKVYLVRHGETEENKLGVIQGQLDTDLNAGGIRQVEVTAEGFKSIPFHMAYTSDLTRAVKTAHSILKYHPNVPLRKDKALRERYLAELEGKPIPKYWNPPSTLETQADFANRAVKWWNVSILHHGGLIRMLTRTLVESRKLIHEDSIQTGELKNCGVVEIDVKSNRKGVLVRYGDMSHFFQLEHALEGNADEIEEHYK